MEQKNESNEKLDYSKNPIGTKIEGFPEFITLLEDGNYKVEMRKIKGVKTTFDYLVLEDIKHSKLKKLVDRAKKPNGEVSAEKLDELMIENAIVFPEVNQEVIEDMKSSEIFRLKKAINVVYDTESFL